MYGYDLKSTLQYSMDMRACRDLLRQGSHSFYAASLLIPGEYRRPITALYAFCRIADDEIDRNDDPKRGLESLHARLSRIYADRPYDHAVDRAFSDLVQRFEIPFVLPAALLEGFDWDVRGRHYETLSDVYAYSARVAGTVGAMMAMIMGVRDPQVLSRACDLGVAMQLTNICRDVGEDARNGRLYLPAELLRNCGVEAEAWMRNPIFNEGISQSIEILLEVADRLYLQSEWGISQLPARCRPGIFAARSIYAEIGSEIERRGFDSVSDRAVVDNRRKVRLLATSMRKAVTDRPRDNAPTLSETRFLVDAVAGG
jgi:phytoene synthase